MIIWASCACDDSAGAITKHFGRLCDFDFNCNRITWQLHQNQNPGAKSRAAPYVEVSTVGRRTNRHAASAPARIRPASHSLSDFNRSAPTMNYVVGAATPSSLCVCKTRLGPHTWQASAAGRKTNKSVKSPLRPNCHGPSGRNRSTPTLNPEPLYQISQQPRLLGVGCPACSHAGSLGLVAC